MDSKVILSYLFKMGEGRGTQSPELLKKKPINLALSSASWDHDYCRIVTQQIKCKGRLVVSKCQRFLRLETAAKYFSERN